MVRKFKKLHWVLLAINLIALVGFMWVFWQRRNYEFLVGGAFTLVMIGLVIKLHMKSPFSDLTLILLTVMALAHKVAGSVFINGVRIYGQYLIPGVMRFDKPLHFLGIFTVTLACYYILKPYAKKIDKEPILYILLAFVGLGIGVFWELFEYVIIRILPETGIGGYFNTMEDIIADSVGALLAVVYLNYRGKNER